MIPVCEPKIGTDELINVMECVNTGWISSKGAFIKEFERLFSEYCGSKYGIACSSGTSALHLALASIDVKKGREVIIPDYAMIAVPNSVSYTGARFIPVDVEPDYWTIDTKRVSERINSRTKAIIAMHTYGHPCKMDTLLEIANEKGLYLIEDAAEAHGAEYKGRRVGGIGDIGCFSFYANKIITTGEGGMVVTDNKRLADRVRLLRDHAHEKERFLHRYLGYNYRMTNLQAALGVAQMKRIDEFINTRRNNAYYYNRCLNKIGGIVTPREASWAKNVFWMYSILINNSSIIDRDGLMKYLLKKGVETRRAFYPVHQQPLYKKEYSEEEYPNSDRVSDRGMYLPSGNTLNKERMNKVIETIKEVME